MSNKQYYWRDTWEYQRIIRNLDEYWAKQPEEKYITAVIHFEHENGEHTVKEMIWINPKYRQDAETIAETRKLLCMGTGVPYEDYSEEDQSMSDLVEKAKHWMVSP